MGDAEKPSGVFNNGRAHPANVASIEHDGFRFRSRAEVYVYRALKKRRILCSPLPVWSSPGPERTRLETDFIVCHQGGWMVLEIDGPSHTESPLDADERLRPFVAQHALVHRVSANDCSNDEQAAQTVQRALDHLAEWKKNSR